MSDVASYLQRRRGPILEQAADGLSRMHALHYERAGTKEVQQRLGVLFDQLIGGLTAHDVGPIIVYATRIAEERFEAGYDLSEVQVAFNALEEAMWRHVVSVVPADELVEAIGLLSTVLGYGKDALACKYVALASRSHVRSLDLTALFAGTNS